MRFLIALLPIFFSNFAFAIIGNESGGGGDLIRANFLRVGAEVINYLKTDATGAAIVAINGLDVQALQNTLSIDRIAVSDQDLTDRTSSLVDAVIDGNKVVLNQARWTAIFASQVNIRFLVFHEMLRLTGINDDNYIISKAMFEEQIRREALSPSTSRAGVFCRVLNSDGTQTSAHFSITRQQKFTVRLDYSLASPALKSSDNADSERGSMLATDHYQFTVVSQTFGAGVFDVRFDFTNSTATVVIQNAGGTGTAQVIPCDAYSDNDNRTNAPSSLQAALAFIFDGL